MSHDALAILASQFEQLLKSGGMSPVRPPDSDFLVFSLTHSASSHHLTTGVLSWPLGTAPLISVPPDVLATPAGFQDSPHSFHLSQEACVPWDPLSRRDGAQADGGLSLPHIPLPTTTAGSDPCSMG